MRLLRKPSDLMTSTMKSEPVRSTVNTSTFDGVPISASGDIGGGAPAAAVRVPRRVALLPRRD